MHRSAIEWTDYSGGYANFVRRGKRVGDCEASPGCQNCYVRRYWARRPDVWPDETTIHPDKLWQLARCRPAPNGKPYRRGPGSKPMVFVCDTGDLFHERVPTGFIFEALDVLYSRPDVDWQILTKRHARAYTVISLWLAKRRVARLPAWMWILFTVEDQKRADERMPYLIRVPATVRGLSIEPMLGPVNFVDKPWWDWRYTYDYYKLAVPTAGPPVRWCVVGAESGSQRRPFDGQWARDVRDQCTRAGLAFFYKQGRDEDDRVVKMPELDGKVWSQFPEVGQ